MTDLRSLLAAGDLLGASQALDAGSTPEVGPLTDPAALDLIHTAAGTLDVPGIDELVRSSVTLGRVAVVRTLLRLGIAIPGELVEKATLLGHVEIVRMVEHGHDTKVTIAEVRSAAQTHVAVSGDTSGMSVCLGDLLVIWELSNDAASPIRWERLGVNTVTSLEFNENTRAVGVGCEDEGVLLFNRYGDAATPAGSPLMVGDRTGVGRLAPFGESFFEVPASRPNDQLLAVCPTPDGGLVLADGPDMRGDDLALRLRRVDAALSEQWEWKEPEHASFVNTAVASGGGLVGMVHRTDRGVRVLSIVDDVTGKVRRSLQLEWHRSMIWRELITSYDDTLITVEGLSDVRALGTKQLVPLRSCEQRVISISGTASRLMIGTDSGIETV